MAVRTSQQYQLQEWLSAVELLASEVEAWAKEENWRVEKSSLDSQENVTSVIPVLEITPNKSRERVILEPKSHNVIGSQGRVDLYAYPSLYRVKLLHKPQEQPEKDWVIRTDSGIDWPEAWSHTTFVNLVDLLLKAR